MDYQHTQSSRLTRLGLGVPIAVLAVSLVVVAEPAARVIIGAVLAALSAAWVLFSSLTVSIDGRQLTLRFGPGPIRRSFALASIQQVRPVRNTWLHGWGIHWTPDGWVWNVAGLDAVELEFTDGRRFRVGTDEPQLLAQAIERSLRRAPR